MPLPFSFGTSPSVHSAHRPRWILGAVCSLLACAGTTMAQGFVKGPYLTQSQYSCPPFVFVAMPDTQSGFGTDASEDGNLGLKQASRGDFASAHPDHQRVGTSLRPTAARS